MEFERDEKYPTIRMISTDGACGEKVTMREDGFLRPPECPNKCGKPYRLDIEINQAALYDDEEEYVRYVNSDIAHRRRVPVEYVVKSQTLKLTCPKCGCSFMILNTEVGEFKKTIDQ